MSFNRREFLRATGTGSATILAAGALPRLARATENAASAPETIVSRLYQSLSDQQKASVCFDWDYMDPRRGLLRSRVANNWNITDPIVNSDFYTAEQRAIIRDIFHGMIQPDWRPKFEKQLKDDAGGFGEHQAIAIFGKPGEGKFEFVLTGRHMTLRCDGNSAEHVAFGGPIFYGHDPHGEFNEKADHDGNVFWEQALEANKVYQMLDGRQRKLAEVAKSPREQDSGFRGPEGPYPGIPLSELAADQKEQVRSVLRKLIEPYRQVDQDEVVQCLKAQGDLDRCSLAFYTDKDIGSDGVWDNWRLEGPSFVWYFRGSPHVHVWVNVASDPGVKLNA
jgi:hypothetical protein